MSYDEKPSLQERLRLAFESHDLTLSSRGRGDADYLAALGLAGAADTRVGGALMRVHLAGSPEDFRAAHRAVVAMVRRVATKRGWRVPVSEQRIIAERALEHYVFPSCPACLGRGYQVVPGTPHLSGHSCPECHGSGRRPIQRRHGDRIRDVIAQLEQIEALTERSVASLLG